LYPTISVIIPTFNRYSLLGETLDSIIAQTFKNWECIVVDDGSLDYTSELLDCYVTNDPRIKYFTRPKNRKKGANTCRNFGFEISKGDYINWFDDDDIMHPEKLELQYEHLKNSNYNFTVCKASVFETSTTNIIGIRNENIISENVFLDYLKMNINWLTQPPLWRKYFLNQQNLLFDEELQAAQEWEFHCRMLAVSPKYLTLEKSLIYLRKHNSSITYNANKEFRDWHYFLARLKIYENEKLNLDEEAINFLRNYLINVFKAMVVAKNPFVIKAYKRFIFCEPQLKLQTKFNAFIAMVFYKAFNKGNKFLQKIKF
tara:strand:- start:1268 stop:2212 length:945 start_codon:yes stop_codon:yes gene_type:complete